ncbi:hypothetical protein VTN00DRAFT_9507 [Thermoascus crustaceus]|uniref:uncharacterized protein n=1 Tax=Thermoascus crustaceus TaxID=5088 RepID=UPI00374314C4
MDPTANAAGLAMILATMASGVVMQSLCIQPTIDYIAVAAVVKRRIDVVGLFNENGRSAALRSVSLKGVIKLWNANARRVVELMKVNVKSVVGSLHIQRPWTKRAMNLQGRGYAVIFQRRSGMEKCNSPEQKKVMTAETLMLEPAA